MSTCLVGCPWYSVFFWRWFDFAISCNLFAFWFLLWSLHTIEMIICQRNPLKFETWDSACHLAHVAPAIALKVREGDNFMHTVDLWWCDVVEHDNHSLPWQLNLLAWRSCTTFCWQVLNARCWMKEHFDILDQWCWRVLTAWRWGMMEHFDNAEINAPAEVWGIAIALLGSRCSCLPCCLVSYLELLSTTTTL